MMWWACFQDLRMCGKERWGKLEGARVWQEQQDLVPEGMSWLVDTLSGPQFAAMALEFGGTFTNDEDPFRLEPRLEPALNQVHRH